MANFANDQSQVGLFYESGTYATTSGALHWMGMVQEHTIDENQGVINVRYAGTTTRNVSQFVDGPTEYTGRLSFFPQDWRILKFVLGSCVDGGSPSPYQHNYEETNNNARVLEIAGQSLPTFGIEDGQATVTGSNLIRTVKGAMVNSATFTWAQSEPARVELDYNAQSVTYGSGAKTAITALTNAPFMWQHTQVHLPSGTKLNFIKNVSVRVANNLDLNHYVDNTRNIGLPIPQNRDYEVTLTLNGDDAVTKQLYDQYFLGGSQFNMLLDSNLSTGSRQLLWAFSGCKLVDFSSPTRNEGVVEHSLTIIPTSGTVIEHDVNRQYNNAWSGAGF